MSHAISRKKGSRKRHAAETKQRDQLTCTELPSTVRFLTESTLVSQQERPPVLGASRAHELAGPAAADVRIRIGAEDAEGCR